MALSLSRALGDAPRRAATAATADAAIISDFFVNERNMAGYLVGVLK